MRSSSRAFLVAAPAAGGFQASLSWALADVRDLEAEGTPPDPEVGVEAEAPVLDAEERLALQRAQAEEELEAAVEAARAEGLERGRAEGEAEGHARGLAEGLERGREEGRREAQEALAPLRDALERALLTVQENEAEWHGALEENVCALSTAVARQLVGRELTADPATVGALVRRALAEVPIDQPVRVRVHPMDLALLSVADGEGRAAVVVGRDAAWVADPQVEPGGCMVEGRDRVVDGRVDTALERVYRKLTETHA